MKNLLPLLIAAVVLGFVFFLTSDLRGPDPNTARGSGHNGVQANGTGSTDRGPIVGLEGGTGVGVQSTGTGSGTQGGARTATHVGLGDASAEGMLEVILRHPLGGHAIKGAQVRLLDRGALARGVWAKAQLSTAAKRDLVAVHSQVFATSEEGSALVPSVLDGVILASGDGYEGWLEWVGPLASPVEIPLKAAIDLRVQVVDAEGHPVPNSPVVLCLNDPINPRALDQTASITPSGIANFRRVGATIGMRNDEVGFAVRLALPLVDMDLVPFNHRDLPREPLRLVMPAVGRLMVTVVDAEGTKVPHADITLGRLVRSDTNGEMEFRGEVYRRRAAGFARFENVPVGVHAAIRVSGTGEMRDLIQTISSPKSEDVSEEVTLVWSNSWPVLRARAVDQAGQPLVDRTGRARMNEDGVGRGGSPIKTDNEGHFDLSINRDWTLGTRRELELELFSGPGVAPCTMQLDLSYQPRAGVTEYGDVRFESMTKLASGLVFAEGKPVAGVQVRIMKPVESKVGVQWVPLGALVATSTQDGTFEIYGEEVPTGPAAVMARRRGFRRAYSSELRLPTGGLRLNLVPGEEEQDAVGDKGGRRGGSDGQGGQGGGTNRITRPAGGYPVGPVTGPKGSGKGG